MRNLILTNKANRTFIVTDACQVFDELAAVNDILSVTLRVGL